MENQQKSILAITANVRKRTLLVKKRGGWTLQQEN